MLLDWEEEYELVLTSARELYHVCVKHSYLPVQMVPAARAVLTLQFLYSAALAPWHGGSRQSGQSVASARGVALGHSPLRSGDLARLYAHKRGLI